MNLRKHPTPRSCADERSRKRTVRSVSECRRPLSALHVSSIPKGLCPPAQGCEPASYPGKTCLRRLNPNGVVASLTTLGLNPVGVSSSYRGGPRVARSSQPWAGGRNPFGINRHAGTNFSITEPLRTPTSRKSPLSCPFRARKRQRTAALQDAARHLMRQKSSQRANTFLALLAFLILASLPSMGQTNDAVSREISVFNFGQSANSAEAISREVSLFNFGQPSISVEAISREASVFNFGQPATSAEAISREVSVFNFGQPTTTAEAISREVSVFNFGQPATSAEALSREVSVFNFGQPSVGIEAISREVSVFNRGASSFDAISREVSVFNFVGASLRASSIIVPTDAWTDTPFSLSWVDTNAGNITAAGPWVDKVYLSPSLQFQNASSQFLGSFQITSNLLAGQAVTRNQTVTISPAGITNGQYYIVVLADANGTVPGESGANNPLGISTNLTVHVTPLPD